MGYPLFYQDKEEREYNVAPATASRLEQVHRLQVESCIVDDKTKRKICTRRGWDFEEVAKKEVTYDEHQRRLAKIIFVEPLDDVDWGNLLVGNVQEGLMDFLSEAGGASSGGGGMSKLLSLLAAQGGASTERKTKSQPGASTTKT